MKVWLCFRVHAIYMITMSNENITTIHEFDFILPETCWTAHYYAPLAKAQEAFLDKYAGNKMAEEFVELQRYDAEVYHAYKEFYGYVFYIAKKVK